VLYFPILDHLFFFKFLSLFHLLEHCQSFACIAQDDSDNGFVFPYFSGPMNRFYLVIFNIDRQAFLTAKIRIFSSVH